MTDPEQPPKRKISSIKGRKAGTEAVRVYDQEGHATALEPDSKVAQELKKIAEELIFLSKKRRKTR